MLFTSIIDSPPYHEHPQHVFAIDINAAMVQHILGQREWLQSNPNALAGEFTIDKTRARFLERRDLDDMLSFEHIPDWARGGDDPLDYYRIMMDYGRPTQDYWGDPFGVPMEAKLVLHRSWIGFKFAVKRFVDFKELWDYLETDGMSWDDFLRHAKEIKDG